MKHPAQLMCNAVLVTEPSSLYKLSYRHNMTDVISRVDQLSHYKDQPNTAAIDP